MYKSIYRFFGMKWLTNKNYRYFILLQYNTDLILLSVGLYPSRDLSVNIPKE